MPVKKRARSVKRSNAMVKKIQRKFQAARVKDICPPAIHVVLKYSDAFNLNSTLAGVNQLTRFYRGNSVNDPLFIVGGNSATGHVQWSQFYKKYRVHGSRIHLLCDSEDTGDGAIVWAMPTNSSTTLAEDNRLPIENPYSKFKNMGTASGSNATEIKNYMSTTRIKGVPGIEQMAELAAFTNSDPGSQWFWNIGVVTSDRTTASLGTCNFTVIITYYVEYFDRRVIAGNVVD